MKMDSKDYMRGEFPDFEFPDFVSWADCSALVGLNYKY